MHQHWITIIAGLPLLGAFLVLLLPSSKQEHAKVFSSFIAFVTMILTVLALFDFDPSTTMQQYVENKTWMSAFNINYAVGVDGLSMPMIFLVSLLYFICMSYQWKIDFAKKAHYALLLFSEATMLGLFVANDGFLFLLFWMLSVLPVYFLTAIWGGKEREKAGNRFFIYQMTSAMLLLLVFFTAYYKIEPHSFLLSDLSGGKFTDIRIDLGDKSFALSPILFLTMFFAFALRMALVPFHNWLSICLEEAPSSLRMIVSAVFVQSAIYGYIRWATMMFPQAVRHYSGLLIGLSLFNVLYGAFSALAERDLRKLFSQTTIIQSGMVLLGISILGITAFHGALLQMLSFGVFSALLLALLGTLGDRVGEYRFITDEETSVFGGLHIRSPWFTVFFTIALFSAMSIPGLGGFVSTLSILLGAHARLWIYSVTGLIGMFVVSAYYLWMYKKTFLGSGEGVSVSDLNTAERICLLPLVLLCFMLGFYPTPLIEISSGFVQSWSDLILH